MSETQSSLAKKKSRPITKGTPPLSKTVIDEMMRSLPGWTNAGGKAIRKEYKFKDFHETMKFVNKVADVANAQDHHPDMEVGYNTCVVKFSTHSVGGLSENDFICAAKVEAASTGRSARKGSA
jgi:4a-hydroxytetrahydrobiopterin dehydratase